MNTNVAVLGFVLVMAIPVICSGADSQVAELARLQQAYRAKVEAEVQPVRDKYVEALVALEKKLAAAGKIEDAGEVRAEREIILESKIYAPGYAPIDREVRVETAEELEDFLELSQWAMWLGAKDTGTPQSVEFGLEGVCRLNGQDVTWRVTGDRAVEISSKEWSGKLLLTFDVKVQTYTGRGTGDTMVRYGRLVKR